MHLDELDIQYSYHWMNEILNIYKFGWFRSTICMYLDVLDINTLFVIVIRSTELLWWNIWKISMTKQESCIYSKKERIKRLSGFQANSLHATMQKYSSVIMLVIKHFQVGKKAFEEAWVELLKNAHIAKIICSFIGSQTCQLRN